MVMNIKSRYEKNGGGEAAAVAVAAAACHFCALSCSVPLICIAKRRKEKKGRKKTLKL